MDGVTTVGEVTRARGGYHVWTPCCGYRIFISDENVALHVRTYAGRAEPMWVRCGYNFDLHRAGEGCGEDRAFDAVLDDGELARVSWHSVG